MEELRICFDRLVSQIEALGRPRDAEYLRLMADIYMIRYVEQKDGFAFCKAAGEMLIAAIKLTEGK